MSRKLTQRGRDRRLQILREAARLFSERGYHPTSVADIVASLHRRQGRLLLVLPEQRGAVRRAARGAHQDLRRRQQAAIGDEPDPVARIELGIPRVDGLVPRAPQARSTWCSSQRTEERFAIVVRQNREVAISDAVRHIKDGIVEGRIADQDPEVLAEAVVGVTERLAQTYLLERDDPVDQVADAAVAFCLRGLMG